MRRHGDYVFHPPSGSEVPGKVDANPYLNSRPDDLREMIIKESDPEKKQKMLSALKQWERMYVYPGYPYRRLAHKVATRYLKVSEVNDPSINIPYYQDSVTPQGLGEILEDKRNIHDNYNDERFDYKRDGERPVRDIEMTDGDFLSPSDPAIGDVVKERGDGPDPEGMECVEPPTGGDMEAL